jgi:hypothetical protein
MSGRATAYVWCTVREGLLERLCTAVIRHAGAARHLTTLAGTPGFVEAEADARGNAALVRDIRSKYDEHRRGHGC